jgi:hypothetical protein
MKVGHELAKWFRGVSGSTQCRHIIDRTIGSAAYLVVYYVVIAGAAITIWRSGLIAHFGRTWTVLAITFSVALGALLAVLSRK